MRLARAGLAVAGCLALVAPGWAGSGDPGGAGATPARPASSRKLPARVVDPAQVERADRRFAAGEWAAAAAAYRQVLAANPEDGRAAFRVCQALHRAARFGEAAEACIRAFAMGVYPPISAYAAACAHARAGEVGQGLRWLGIASEAGYRDLAALDADPDLAALRSAPGYAEVRHQVERNATPCRFDARYRAFDFWIGEWRVSVGDQEVGRNRVEPILEGCALRESWRSAAGGTGESLNLFDPASGRWRQQWVDASGGSVLYEGEWRDGAMRLEGVSVKRDGQREPARMTFTPGPDGTVRQLVERSPDGGKSWTVSFDGRYEKVGKGPPAAAPSGLQGAVGKEGER